MNRRLIVLLVLSSLTAYSCANSASNAASQIRTGELPAYAGGIADSLPVGVIPDANLRDNGRNKDIRLSIEYPVRPAGPHPLIVFSPQFRLTNRDYVGLSSFWASRGYVVIRASHADTGEESSQTPADWRNRVRDLTYVLDSLPQLTQRYPELGGKIDETKIAVAGHGYGSFAALLLGGVQTFPGAVRYADPRIKAVIAISPPGVSETRGLTRESWANVTVPVLFLTGNADQGALESETPEWRREAFALAPAGDKWLVVLQGARHGTFTGRFDGMLDAAARERARTRGDVIRPEDTNVTRDGQRISREESVAFRQQDVFNTGRGIALAFLDAYLRADAEGRKALENAGTRAGTILERK